MAATMRAVMIPDKKALLPKVGARILGTVIGVIILILMHKFILSREHAILIIFFALFLFRTFLHWNYTFDATFFTFLVFGMMALSSPDLMDSLEIARVKDTLIGAGITVALSLFLLFIYNRTSSDTELPEAT